MKGRAVFAKRLKEAREASGLSQKQLGIQAGVDQFVASARINQYERGKHVPDLLTAQNLAKQLQAPVSYLYETDDLIAALIMATGKLSSPKLKALLKSIVVAQTGLSSSK